MITSRQDQCLPRILCLQSLLDQSLFSDEKILEREETALLVFLLDSVAVLETFACVSLINEYVQTVFLLGSRTQRGLISWQHHFWVFMAHAILCSSIS